MVLLMIVAPFIQLLWQKTSSIIIYCLSSNIESQMPEQVMPQIRSASIKVNTIVNDDGNPPPLTRNNNKSVSMKKLNFVPTTTIHHRQVNAQLYRKTPQKKQKQKEKANLLSERRGSRLIQLSQQKLSPIKQYQTKLRISAESWLVYDYRRDSYKRGWKPSDVKQFDGVIRLVVFKVFLDLLEANPQLADFQLRVNQKYLKEQIQMLKNNKRSPDKKYGVIIRQAMSKGLVNNTLIGMIDLLYGIFMTNFDDMVEYSIIFMGYLCNCHVHGTNPISEQSPCHYIESIQEAVTYAEYFAQYVNQILFPALEMKESKFQPKYYDFFSSANDICRLYLSIENSVLLGEILDCKERLCKIKYQIGFRYWQNRTLTLKNSRINLGERYFCVFNWKAKKNYSVVCKNSKLNILIVLEDCKFGMAERDIFHVEEWVTTMLKPIVDNRRTHTKLLPLLRPIDCLSPSPDKMKKEEDSFTQN